MYTHDDFVIKDGVLKKYKGPGGDVVIPDGVTKIGPAVFRNCEWLTDITIPEGVTAIGCEAFFGCSKIKSVSLPDSVKCIGARAFMLCFNLLKIRIPEGVTVIGDGAFCLCWRLGSVTIPAGVKRIEEQVFRDSSLDEVVLLGSAARVPDGLHRDAEAIIAENMALSSFSPANKKAALRGFAARRRSGEGLPASYVSDYLRYLKRMRKRYWDDPEFLRIMIEEGLLSYEDTVFLTDLYSTKEDAQTAAALLEYAGRRFPGDYAVRLFEKKAADSEKYAERWFARNGGRREEDGISGLRFFISSQDGYRRSLKEYILSHGAGFTSGVTGRTDYFVAADQNRSARELAGAKELGVPVLSREEFELMVCIKFKDEEHVDIPRWVKRVMPRSFAEHTKLRSVTIPDSVTEIGDYAFEGCASLTSVTIPGSVSWIGHRAFGFCTKLTDVVISPGVSEICSDAFSNCWNLAGVTLPDSVTEIGTNVFAGCRNLTLRVPAGSFAEQYARRRRIPFKWI